MVRVLAAAFCLFFLSFAWAEDGPGIHDLASGIDVGFVDVNGYDSWTEGSVGKLRYQEDGFQLANAFIDYRGRWADTLQAQLVLEAYDDDLGPVIGLSQAYLEWRPIPKSASRYRLKVGTFYPKVSLENVDRGWRSPYSLSWSAINTWVAEELRSTGAELTVSRRPASLGGAHTFSLSVSAFMVNDPAGTLLAWKGWSVHDRQTRFGDKLPLAQLPQIEPGMMFQNQDPFVDPFIEVDDKVGYYVNADWRYRDKFMLRLMVYDNRADPEDLDGGQYAWRTDFWHLGIQATLPGNIGFIAQAMTGTTVMGPVMNGVNVIAVDYESQFGMLSRAFGPHRVSARFDNFSATDNDGIPQDANDEDGHAWTVAYRFDVSDNVAVAAEWLSIETQRSAWAYFGIPTSATERQSQLMLQVRF